MLSLCSRLPQGLLPLDNGNVLVSFMQGGVAVVRVEAEPLSRGRRRHAGPRLLSEYTSTDGLWNLSSTSPTWSFS
jgi:hypothetical protein